MIILNNNKCNQNTVKNINNNIYLLHPNNEETTLSICSVNITFTKTKRRVSLIYGTSAILFTLKLFLYSMVYYCDLPVTNPVMVILQIMFVMTFLVTSLVWQFCHGCNFVLLSANTTFYQIYHHLWITVKFFLYLINFVWIFTF